MVSYITAGKLQRKRKTLHREYAWIRKPRMGKVNSVFLVCNFRLLFESDESPYSSTVNAWNIHKERKDNITTSLLCIKHEVVALFHCSPSSVNYCDTWKGTVCFLLTVRGEMWFQKQMILNIQTRQDSGKHAFALSLEGNRREIKKEQGGWIDGERNGYCNAN